MVNVQLDTARNGSASYFQMLSVARGALLCLVLAGVGPAGPRTGLERSIFDLVNRERRHHGMTELRWNEPLAEAARRHARSMATRGFFSHDDPVRGNLAARLREHGVAWRKCAENIYEERGYPDAAKSAVKSWMNSPGHRRNILDPELTDTGIGGAVDARDQVVVVQDFLR
jgi:uncharacterized protein YkwD